MSVPSLIKFSSFDDKDMKPQFNIIFLVGTYVLEISIVFNFMLCNESLLLILSIGKIFLIR